MLRNALAVAALLSLSAAPLAAQQESGQPDSESGSGQSQSGGSEDQQSSSQDESQPAQNVVTARMLQDASVVSLEGQYDETVWQDGPPLGTMVADLTEIGRAQDLVLSAEGEMQGITVDVGGFLGIGTKAVLIPLGDMRLARSEPGAEELTIVTRLNEQQLNDLPEFEMEQ